MLNTVLLYNFFETASGQQRYATLLIGSCMGACKKQLALKYQAVKNQSTLKKIGCPKKCSKKILVLLVHKGMPTN